MILKQVKAETTLTVSPSKTTTAVCSIDGTSKLYGTGFKIETDSTPGDIFVNRVDPSRDLAFVGVSAVMDDASSPGWNLTAYAICANPVTGLTFKQGSVASSSVSPKTPTASCDTGTSLHGLGFAMNADFTQVNKDVLVDLQEIMSLTSGRATFRENDATTLNWTARVTAICAP